MPTGTYLKSSIWNGIKKHVHTVNDNTKWLLGSGHSVSFWLDNWLDEPLAVKFNFLVTVYPLLKAKVASFIENGEWILPATFVNHDVSIRDRIHEITLPRQPMEDRLIWCAYNDGNLTAKQAYVLLFPTQQKLDWTGWIWHNFVPPSSSFVAWRCFQNRMPTDENLRKRGCVVVSACDLCLSQSETTPHLFLTCSFANNLWKWLGSILHIQFNCSSFHSLFESFDANWSAFLTNIATAAVLHVFHSIWLARNGIRFSNAKITMHAAQSKILTASKLSATLAPGLSNAAEIAILQKFQLAPRPAAASSNRLVLWRSPIFGWMKANTDGSVTNVSAAYGGLFRDHTTRFRGVLHKN
ncbi:unnamed protein product [Trifolium pratense]|uniref:Uncharacterized protein n=1 Tax=Trifolium pratense TaxID=57577 RepID=A0ACB0IX60_TRIPR|nr:unnamed protein product [Trifolium pratense]